jgi:hypothetical protein
MSDATATTENKVTPKKILVGIVSKFADTNVDLVALLGADLAKQVADFYDGLKTTAVRGLPATERLAMVQALIRSHYENMPAIDSPEHGAWAYESMKLLQRQERINREIADGGAHVVKGTGKGKAAKK